MRQIDKLIDVALGEVGYLEKASLSELDGKTKNAGDKNYTRYWRDIKPAWQGQPWCACFVSWCARQAGIGEDVLPAFFDCDAGMLWFRKRGQFVERGEGAPLSGDVVFFGVVGDSTHVGLVTEVKNRIYTIEGNTSSAPGVVPNGGAVVKKSYLLSHPKIIGYGRPLYGRDDVVTYEDFKAFAERYEAERREKPASEWAGPTWDKLTAAKVFDGTAPQAPLTREQAAALIERLKWPAGA
jgi:hypothetical protein